MGFIYFTLMQQKERDDGVGVEGLPYELYSK